MTTTTPARDLVETSMADFLREQSGLRYTFFGGEGGVGKTVMAAMTPVHLAKSGKRTLLASTNPVHSLSGCLGQSCFGKATPVTGVENLWAHEIDTREAIERSKREIREKIQWFLKFAEISTKADEFVEAATMNPAFEESAMFENMVYLVDFRERIRHARELLTDPSKTAFFFVTLPEALPIAVIRRFISWFTDFGIPVGGVVVNMVIRPEEGEAAPDFVRNRIEMQAGYLDEIRRTFDGQVRAVIPLFDSDVRGVKSLERAAAA